MSWSPMLSSTHSSVTWGSTTSCTALSTTTVNSASSWCRWGPRRSAVRRRPRHRQLAVESGGHPALTDLVQPVLRVQPGAGSPSSRPTGQRRLVARLRPAGRRRPATRGGLTSASMASSTSSWDGSRAGSSTRNRRNPTDLGADLAGGIEVDRPVLGPAVISISGVAIRSTSCSRTALDRYRDGVADACSRAALLADARLEHLARRLAGTEPGKTDLAGDLAECLVDVSVDRSLAGDRQLHELLGRGILGASTGSMVLLTGSRCYRRAAATRTRVRRGVAGCSGRWTALSPAGAATQWSGDDLEAATSRSSRMPTPSSSCAWATRFGLDVELPSTEIGTVGKVILANGFNWHRYRVLFTNGLELADLDGRQIEPYGRQAPGEGHRRGVRLRRRRVSPPRAARPTMTCRPPRQARAARRWGRRRWRGLRRSAGRWWAASSLPVAGAEASS